jgi:hypothetical protein
VERLVKKALAIGDGNKSNGKEAQPGGNLGKGEEAA